MLNPVMRPTPASPWLRGDMLTRPRLVTVMLISRAVKVGAASVPPLAGLLRRPLIVIKVSPAFQLTVAALPNRAIWPAEGFTVSTEPAAPLMATMPSLRFTNLPASVISTPQSSTIDVRPVSSSSAPAPRKPLLPEVSSTAGSGDA